MCVKSKSIAHSNTFCFKNYYYYAVSIPIGILFVLNNDELSVLINDVYDTFDDDDGTML